MAFNIIYIMRTGWRGGWIGVMDQVFMAMSVNEPETGYLTK